MSLTPAPLHLAFLGCGFITRVHSRHLRRLRPDVVCSYASRDRTRAENYCHDHGGRRAFGSYEAAIADPEVEAVVVAVPPRFHRELTLQALAAGKHVLVEKPAYPTTADYEAVLAARQRAGRVVLVGENDHYKPLAVCLRRLLIRKEFLIPILCGIFVIENLSVVIQVSYFKYTRKKYGVGRRIFLMSPIHHHFQKQGIPEAKIVTRFWIIGIILAVLTIVTLKVR
jgi:hypothetical protein